MRPRYRYGRLRFFPPTYTVHQPTFERFAVVMRSGPPPVEGTRKWRALLDRDPLVEGYGRSRDAAVEDALRQVGGLG